MYFSDRMSIERKSEESITRIVFKRNGLNIRFASQVFSSNIRYLKFNLEL